jgi:hypothetical protein
VQARRNYRAPGIIEREPDAPDSLTEPEPKSPMIARPAADDREPLYFLELPHPAGYYSVTALRLENQGGTRPFGFKLGPPVGPRW